MGPSPIPLILSVLWAVISFGIAVWKINQVVQKRKAKARAASSMPDDRSGG